jgi:hypothetical protein
MPEPDRASVLRELFSACIREHLERAPLLVKAKHTFLDAVSEKFLGDCTPKALTRGCPTCQNETTWRLVGGGMDGILPPGGIPESGATFHLRYGCSDCSREEVNYWLNLVTMAKPAKRSELHLSFSEMRGLVLTGDFVEAEVPGVGTIEIRKLGQMPPWAFPVPKRVSKALGESSMLFSRALACFAQGYGIAAAAYLRRIVEDKTQVILHLVKDAAELAQDAEAIANIKEALLAHTASDRLRIAAQRLPARVKIGGRNPLDVMYGLFSAPLHGASDEEAMEIATELLQVFDFLFEVVQEGIDRERQYAERMKAAASRLDGLRRERKSDQ